MKTARSEYQLQQYILKGVANKRPEPPTGKGRIANNLLWLAVGFLIPFAIVTIIIQSLG